MALLSALSAAVAELAANSGVTAIVGVDQYGIRRIRQIEPLGTVGTVQGDARGPGAYIPFVIVDILDARQRPRTPIREVSLGLRCYAATYPAAEALYLACEAVFIDRPSRVAGSGLGIWHSTILSGGTPDRDPVTKQPLFAGIVNYPTTILAVPA